MTSNAMRTINAGKNAVKKVKDDPQAMANIQNPTARQQTRQRFLEKQSAPRQAPPAPAPRPKSLQDLQGIQDPTARQQGRMNFLQRQQPQGSSPVQRPTGGSPMSEALMGQHGPASQGFNPFPQGLGGAPQGGGSMWQGGSSSFNESASRAGQGFSPTNGGMFTNPQAPNPYLPSNPNIIPDGYGGAAGGFRPGATLGQSYPGMYPKRA